MKLLELFEKNEFSTVIQEWEIKQYQPGTDPESAFIVAASQFRLGNVEEAASICQQIQGVFSNNENFLSLYAAIQRRLGLLKSSEEMFKRAMEIAPDAIDVRNNYSNLLIDQKRYDEASNILKAILKEDPNYFDAQQNLKRVDEMKEQDKLLSAKSEEKEGEDGSKGGFGDPLEEAFEVNEVALCGAKIGKDTSTLKDLIPEPEQSDLEQADLELFQLAAKQIKEKQFFGAIELLQRIRTRKGAHHALYQKGSEAMIGLNDYRHAEIFCLLAYVQGDRSIANFLNLASLAAMRKDQIMANNWLNQAKDVDETNELLIQSKEMLFPGGKARDEDAPFKGK